MEARPVRTADQVLEALLLDLASDPEIAPYLHYVAMPMQLVPAEKTLGYIERVIQAYGRARFDLKEADGEPAAP